MSPRGQSFKTTPTGKRKALKAESLEQTALLSLVQDAVIAQDLRDRILIWNNSAERIYGWTAGEAVGADIREVLYKENLTKFEEIRACLISKGEWAGELQQTSKTGKLVITESRLSLIRGGADKPGYVLSVSTDITQKKDIEQQLHRAVRMSSIGGMATGIAHDMQNILSPVVMTIEALRATIKDEESQYFLAMLKMNAEHGIQLINKVLSLARGEADKHSILRTREIIREIVEITKATFPKSIEVRLLLPDDLWNITGDAAKLRQVIMNLCINARDAMPDGGKLTVNAENVFAPDKESDEPSPFVLIKIADEGTGIASGIVNRIFDPFFTTKEPSRGTGLGLSTSLAIVQEHGGSIDVRSTVGVGTEFLIYLPARA